MVDISVVIATRGPDVWLREAIESLGTEVLPQLELIVVEDGTRYQDGGELRRLAPQAALLSLPHVGRSAARNAGVERARAPLVAFLDADDRALPGRLARQAETLERAPGTALCYGRVEKIDERSRLLPEETAVERRRFDRLLARGTSYESLLLDCPIYTSATMVRRPAFHAVGGYRPQLDAFEDLDLYLRLTRVGALVPCNDPPVAQHRIHEGNTRVDDLFAGSVRLARLHLAEEPESRPARRLLLERELEGLWGLGAFRQVRSQSYRALLSEPLLLARPGFRRRLVRSGLPAPLLAAIRRRRR